MKKALFFLLTIFVLASVALAQENMGARPIGMGGAFTGVADDANAIFVNPAGIGYLPGEAASVSTKILEGKEYTIIGGVERTSIGNFGIGYVGASVPIECYSETADLEEEGNQPTRALNQTLILSYGRELNDFMVVPDHLGKLSVGTNFKFSRLQVNDARGVSSDRNLGVNADVALLFKPTDSLSCGLNFQDLFDKESQSEAAGIKQESKVAFGIAGNLLNKSVIWSVEGKSMGCELRPVQGLALRLGKDGDYSTAGFGVNVNGFSIDYAYMQKEAPIHYVGISIAVDRESKASLKQASL